MTEALLTLPLLFAEEARIAVDGVVVVDRLTLSTTGDHVLFAGDPSALFAALTGVPLSRAAARARSSPARPPARPTPTTMISTRSCRAKPTSWPARSSSPGATSLTARTCPSWARRRSIPPLPPGWTAEEYVAWGARLGGARRGVASDLAAQALARTGLLPARKRSTSALSQAERRALALAQAIVTAPEVLIAESPLAGLEGAAATFVLDALVQATEGRRAIFSVTRIDPSSPEGRLARASSHVVVLAGGDIALEGTPSELFSGVRVYSVTVHKNAEPLRAELASRGIRSAAGLIASRSSSRWAAPPATSWPPRTPRGPPSSRWSSDRLRLSR